MSGVRDHAIFVLTVRYTHDIKDDDNNKIGETEVTEIQHVVAETEAIARAWAMSGTRAFAGRDREILDVKELGLDAIITTEIY